VYRGIFMKGTTDKWQDESFDHRYNNVSIMNYQEIVDKLNEIKSKVENHKFNNEEELRKSIEGISKCIWNDIDNINAFDLRNMCKIHEFLIDEVIKTHCKEEDQSNESVFRNTLSMKDIKDHGIDGKRSSRIYLFNDPSYEYYFVGDIHSDDFIISRILEECNFFKKIIERKNSRLIFLGDYVDRGKNHLKTIEKILILKYIFPGNIFLIRGNHDGGIIEGNGVKLSVRKPLEDNPKDYFILFLDILSKNNGSFSRDIIKKYLELFDSMAIISIIIMGNKVIMGAHGGLPRPHREKEKVYEYIKSIKDLTNVSIKDSIGKTIVQNILWSDPLRDRRELREDSGRFRFKEDEFYEFCTLFGVDIFIRGHEAHENGCEKYFNDGVYSVFSSGQIIEEGNNINFSTAYEYVNPKVIKFALKEGIKVLPIK